MSEGEKPRRRRERPRPMVESINEPSVEAVLGAQLCLLSYPGAEIERLLREREERLRAEKGGDA